MKDLNVDLESFSKEEFEEEELGDEEEENVLAGGCLDNCCNHISCLLICIEELIVSFLIAIWWFNLIYISAIIVLYVICLFGIHCSAYYTKDKKIFALTLIPRILTSFVLLVIDGFFTYSFFFDGGRHNDFMSFFLFLILPVAIYVISVACYMVTSIRSNLRSNNNEISDNLQFNDNITENGKELDDFNSPSKYAKLEDQDQDDQLF